MTRNPDSVGSIAGHRAGFYAKHRDGNPSPAVFEATATIPVSVEDIVAAVWLAVRAGYFLSDLTDPAHPDRIHELTVDSLFNDPDGVEDARLEIETGMRPGSVEHSLVSAIRNLVTSVYGAPATRRAGRATGRTLATAGVSA